MRQKEPELNRRSLRILIPVGLFLIAVAVRALPWLEVIGEDRIYPFGFDSFYHLRRILFAFQNFPASLDFDPYINFPTGARSIWSPAFDWVSAAVIRPFVSDFNPGAVERLVVWIPPLLGGASVVTLYFLARRQLGTQVAITSSAILSVLSGHFWYSQIGFVDHHAAVSLSSTLLLATALAVLGSGACGGGGREDSKGKWGLDCASVGCGAMMAAALLIWPGSLLHVVLIEAGLLAYLLTRSERSDAAHFAARLAVLHGTALIIILAFHPGSDWQQWGRFSPVVLTDFQPWLFGSLTAFFIACTILWRLTSLGHGGRWMSAIALGGGALVISAILSPELLQGAGDAWQWFSKEEDFQRSVNESQPLFSSGHRFAQVAVLRLSCFIFVFPIAACLLAWSSRKKTEPAADWMVLGWAFALFAVTLVQKRFFNSFSVALALIMGWSACQLYAALPAGWRKSRARRRTCLAVVAMLFVGLLLPTLRAYERSVTNHWYWLNGEDARLHIVQTRQRAAIEAARWLRQQTPPTSGWFDSEALPEYSVLSPWKIGHIIEYEARRPTVADNFGDDLGSKNFALARNYYGSREVKAIKILDQLGVRYVIAEQQPDYLLEKPSRKSVAHAMYELDGSEFTPPPDTPNEKPIRALKRHRLIYESRRLAFYPSALPPFKIFEYVKGARLTGRAAPGESVRIAVGLHTNTLRKIVYTRTVTANSKGRYTAILPYANRGHSSAIRVDPNYTIDCRLESAAVIIDESAVISGNAVEGPDLCLDESM